MLAMMTFLFALASTGVNGRPVSNTSRDGSIEAVRAGLGSMRDRQQ